MRFLIIALVEKAAAALARNDFDALAALRPAGERMPPGIAQKLPAVFRKLAISRLLQTCNACHAAYRF